jgi:hypothetical protein
VVWMINWQQPPRSTEPLTAQLRREGMWRGGCPHALALRNVLVIYSLDTAV